VRAIARLHDDAGRITLPGFYDRTDLMKTSAWVARLPMNATFYFQTGCPDLFDRLHSSGAGYRPTLEVNGLLSGFTGEGSKTVLPSKAMAKISTRLVPDQDPYEVRQQMSRYLEENVPPTIRWELVMHSTGFPSITDRQHPAVIAMSKALEATWGKRPLFQRRRKHPGCRSNAARIGINPS
jgi:acetylornithine deacetylase/succinyl-diaminopimelate desuccinylase-like protein